MKRVDRISEILIEKSSGWNGLEAIFLNPLLEKDILDPYFTITYDFFFKGDIPSRKERMEIFKAMEFFETAITHEKDRFLYDNIPVRIEYKLCSKIENLLSKIPGGKWLSIESNSYPFYRLINGKTIFSKSDWLEKQQEPLMKLDTEFWYELRKASEIGMEHTLIDLESAAVKQDKFYFTISLASFMKYCLRSLLAINKILEPPSRFFEQIIPDMTTLPLGFKANWESLLREDSELSLERKKEVAVLLAKSILLLS